MNGCTDEGVRISNSDGALMVIAPTVSYPKVGAEGPVPTGDDFDDRFRRVTVSKVPVAIPE